MTEDRTDNFDYKSIDGVIHGRVRLSIMAYLSSVRAADFGALKLHTGVTDGNLSVHLRKLEDAGYVEAKKQFVGRRPQTLCSLTKFGRDAWIRYIDHMEGLLGKN
ncbi:MAG: transcriptional regulator [Erythrobacter sp.]|uniref:winged helix-turn-helix domain-containing protein n=1 Tax=Erythrobacter sp. TaxID=1042 RepID=UPI0032661EEE